MHIENLVSKSDFPASQQSAYLNAASISPMYLEAAKAVLAWQKDVAFNGTINFDEVAEEEIYHELHEQMAVMLNASPANFAAGSSTTELMSSLAWAVYPEKGKKIISTVAAHPSTIYAWQRVARQTGSEVHLVQEGEDGCIDPNRVLGAISPDTVVVCLSMVEYRTGQLYDLKAISSAVHAHGGLLVVDATQAVGQVPIDVPAMGVDALISSGYKWLCGPFGIAVMYLAPALYTRLDPGIVGWRSHKVMWQFSAERLEYPQTAARFEAGTMAYGCALGLAKAVEFLNRIGVSRILQHNRAIADTLGEALHDLGADMVTPAAAEQCSSIISVRFPGRDAATIARHLNAQNVVVSERGGVIRISPHLYNDENDIDRAVEVVKQALIADNI